MASAIFKLQKTVLMGLVSLVIFSVANASWAVPVESVPNPRQTGGGWVSDRAELLSPPTEAELNRIISQLELKNGSEIAIVTVPDTAPSASPKEFATTLFNRWGIGKKGENNGVLFLISKGDRRVEIETGDGLESILPNAKLASIISAEITPRFKNQDFNGGVLAGTQALIGELNYDRLNLAVTTSPTTTITNKFPLLNWLIGIGGIIFAILGTIGVVKFIRQRQFLAPEGMTCFVDKDSSDRQIYHCDRCQQRMKKVDDAILSSSLSASQLAVQQLGSVKFAGWQCPRCLPSLTGARLHKIAYILDSQKFTECPNCQELTASSKSQILLAPTSLDRGQQRVELTCYSCDYQTQFEVELPQLKPPVDAVFLTPEGRSRIADQPLSIGSKRESAKATHCIKCNWQMSPVSAKTVAKLLSPAEKVARQLGSVKFIGWQCLHCSPLLTNPGFHLRAYVLNLPNYQECQTCQELTVKFSQRVLQAATTYSTGKILITERCHCCGYQRQQKITIPRLSSTDSNRGSSDDSSSYSSDRNSSGSSDSSGDFGGGSSDGGGAGGDW